MSETALSNILKTLTLNDSDANRAALDVGGVVPCEVARATQIKNYQDGLKDYAGEEFSFTDLEIEFQKHCKDYSSAINSEASRAVEFASKILFEVGPQIRKEKKSKGDKMVKFVFPYKRDETILSIHTVYVRTFKDTKFDIGSSTDNTMVLTFKQAGLLATKVLNKLAEYLYNQKTLLVMTPLCAAIYLKEDVPKLASVLKMQPVEVVKMLNASCCSGGQHLDESNIACAIAAALCSTRKADKNIRDSIVSQVVKQYSKKKKIYNETEFQTFRMYAHGGVPAGLDAATLIEKFDNIQAREATIRAQKAVNDSSIQSISTKVSDTSATSATSEVEQSTTQGE